MRGYNPLEGEAGDRMKIALVFTFRAGEGRARQRAARGFVLG